MSGAPEQRFILHPSPALAGLILAAHGTAAACIFLTAPGWAGGALALLLVALGAASAWSRALLRAPLSVRGLRIGAAGLVVETADGASHPAEPANRRYVSRIAVTLPLRRPWRRTVLVAAGMLAPDDFRRLRVWALWGRLPAMAVPRPAA